MDISCEFSHCDTEILETFLEVSDDFRYQGLHGGYVDYLEVLDIELSIVLPLGTKHLEDSQQGYVGLASTCWSTDEQVLICGEGLLINSRLDIVESD